MNILIVDDDEHVRNMLRTLVQHEGHRALVAADGVAALEVLRHEPVDVIISDLMMPRMDGYRLCQAVRRDKRLKDIPFIFHTATYTLPEDEQLAFDLGGDVFLRKPASVDTVLAALRRVTGRPRTIHQRPAVTPPESDVMSEYSERLVAKLEQRTVELAAAETKFRTLVEQSITGIYIIQEERFAYVNPRMAEIFGTTPAAMTGRPVYDFVVPEDHALVRENLRKRIAGEVPSIRYGLRMCHQSGAVLQVEVHGTRADYDGRAAVMETLLDVTERQRAIEARDKERELLRTLVDNLPAYIFAKDRAGHYLVSNDAHTQLLGAGTETELLDKTVFDYFPPEVAAAYAQDDEELLRTGKPVIQREEAYEADGKRRWFSLTKVPLRDQQGNIAGLIGIKHDITERKLAEQALHESEAALAMFFRASPALISITTVADGRLIHFNERYCEFFGYEQDEMIGKTVHELNLWADPADRLAAVERLRQAGEIHGLEVRCRLRSGEVRHALGSMELIDLAGESEPVMISMFTDITERKRVEEKLAEERKLLRTLVDNLPAHVFAKDTAGRYLLVNDPHRRQLGLSADTEMFGKTSFDFFPAEIAREFEADDQSVIQTGEPVVDREEPYEAGGKRGWYLTTKVPLRDAQGKITGLVGIAQDITQRKQLEAQFLRSQRMESLGSLAGGIAHDLNNALAPIVMASEFLKLTCKDPEDGRVLDTICDSAKRGAGMVKQILTFARGSEGERGLVQPKHLVKETIDMARHTFPKAIQIRTDIATDTWPLHGNPTQLHQILLNLCVNARDAMPKGGILTLATGNVHLDATCAQLSPDAKPGSYVLLTVSDTGTGMPPEVRARIFDAFFTTKAPDKGTGLGLSTVQNIVKDHGGFLTVDSAVGQGTTFKVYLPAQETTAVTATVAAPPALPTGNGELILVVDDEAAIRNIATQTIEAFGYRVVTANDGAQAVGVCAQNLAGLQLLITDMAMPIMDGKATIRAIRTLLPRLPVIAVSGSDSLAGTPLQKELDVQAFLRKPFSAEDLIRTIHAVLQEKAPS